MKEENSKKIIVIVSIIIIALILLISGFIVVKKMFTLKPQDQYETIAEANNNYIHYQFNFAESEESHKYKIKGYTMNFVINEDGGYSYDFGNKEKVSSLARKYDVYYLKKIKSLIVLDVSDFGMGMNIVNKDGIKSLSNFVNGAFSIDNLIIEENKWEFDVIRYSDNYLVVTPKSIFNLCVDKYADYTTDDYGIVETYKYDLSKKDFTLDDFDVEKKMTIKELYEVSKDKCKNVDNSEMLGGDTRG